MKETKFKDALALWGEQAAKDIAAGEEIADVFIKYRTQVVERVHAESNGDSWPNVVNDIAFLLFVGAVAEDQRGKSCEVRDITRDALDISEETNDILLNVIQKKENKARNTAKTAAAAKHAPTAKLKESLREVWATGKYKSRDLCAEQEYEGLGFASFKTARNALINTLDPSPWPARLIR